MFWEGTLQRRSPIPLSASSGTLVMSAIMGNRPVMAGTVVVSRSKEETETAHSPEIAGVKGAQSYTAAVLWPAGGRAPRSPFGSQGSAPGLAAVRLALWGPMQECPAPFPRPHAG